MRVAMLALMVSALVGTTATTSSAQVTGGPVVRGRAGEVPRDDRDRRDGDWDWRRDGDRRSNDRWDNDRWDNDRGRYDRRDRDWDKNRRKRERELAKRFDRCQRDLWRNSRERRDDRWSRGDARDRMQNQRERERISRICEREVYGYRRW